MENINIAELLTDCPQGMKLYSPIFGDVYLDKVRPHLAIVVTTDKEQGIFKEEFLYDGRYGMNGECMLFPSKDQRDWNKFQRPFKNGDIIVGNNGCCSYITIFKSHRDPSSFNHYASYTSLGYLKINDSADSSNLRFATEEEKQKLFEALRRKGYQWNEETKTLIDLNIPKFSVGDRIRSIKNTNEEYTITAIYKFAYDCKNDLYTGFTISIKSQNDWELVNKKFDISTLVPYESRVLVRNHKSQTWRPAIWGFFDENCGNHLYGVVGGNCFAMCIPFEGNENLRGKKGDCDKFYQTWKE